MPQYVPEINLPPASFDHVADLLNCLVEVHVLRDVDSTHHVDNELGVSEDMYLGALV